MAVGDLITGPGQVEIGEVFRIGGSVARVLSSVDGTGLPDVVDDDAPGGHSDGAVPGIDRYDKRQVVVTTILNAASRSALNAEVDALAAAMHRLQSGHTPLALRLGATSPRWLRARPRGLRTPWDDQWTAHGLARQVVATFVATDPYAYGLTVTTDTVTIAASATSESGVVNNGGTGRMKPTLTITGPATNPRVQNASLNGTPEVRLQAVLGGADVVVVDLRTQTVTLNGTEDDSLWAPDTEWWSLQPGNNSLVYSRDDSPATASTLEVDHAPGYLTLV